MTEKSEKTPRMSNADMFRIALKNYKNVYYSNSKNKKFDFIPRWLLLESKLFLEEKKHYTHYKTFKRGAIVNVDFGVNIGDELSGPHFAIILDKNDTPTSGTLTVLPLTSHNHPNEIELTDTIRNISSSLFRDAGLGAMLAIYAAEIAADEFYLRANPDFPNAKTRLKNSLNNTDDHEIGESTFEILTHLIPDKQHAFKLLTGNGRREKIDLSKLLKPDGSPSDAVRKSADDLIWTKKKYEHYNKTTYAKISDITTISKQRLKRLSRFDPIGKILVSNETLTKIDQALAQLFIKKSSLVDNEPSVDDN